MWRISGCCELLHCNGSDSYLSWIDNVLEINLEATDEFDFDYDIKICDSPKEVRELILKKDKINA